jgi:hypothetical protein
MTSDKAKRKTKQKNPSWHGIPHWHENDKRETKVLALLGLEYTFQPWAAKLWRSEFETGESSCSKRRASTVSDV